MIEDKDHRAVERDMFEAGHLDPFEVDSERESNERNYDATDHRKG